MAGIGNERIKMICDKITNTPISGMTTEKILNNELLYKALKNKEIDCELLLKYSKPCEWFDDISLMCANQEWYSCDDCWKATLQMPVIQGNAKENYEYPNILNPKEIENYYAIDLEMYPDNVQIQEELDEYKELGLSIIELKQLLMIFKWDEFRDFDLLIQQANEVMTYRG